MFEIAASIQSPGKCQVRSVIRFRNVNGERPEEIHKQIVALYCKVMNRQNVTKWCLEFSEGRTDFHDEQRAVSHLSSQTKFFRKLKKKFAQIDALR